MGLPDARKKPKDPSMQFTERINDHDLVGLVRLMTPDHVFTDSLGTRTPRPAIEHGWREYFGMVPDYWIKIDEVFSEGDTRLLVGRAGGTYVPEGGNATPKNRWETRAVWIARIRGNKVAEWRIYSDNEPIRQRMREANS